MSMRIYCGWRQSWPEVPKFLGMEKLLVTHPNMNKHETQTGPCNPKPQALNYEGPVGLGIACSGCGEGLFVCNSLLLGLGQSPL